MNRWSELFLIPRNYFKFKPLKKIIKYQMSCKYQIIDFFWKQENKNQSLPLSITFNPFSFYDEYETLLNKRKKILIYGNWQDLKYYYHFLRNKNFNVYLLR